MVLADPGCDSSRPVPVGDARPDATATDLPPGAEQVFPRDSSADIDLTFPAVLEGVWLVGWYQNAANHFSWVRFAEMATPLPPNVKIDAWILAGYDIPTNDPLWKCSGKATYWMGAAGNTIYLDFPSTDCLADGSDMQGYVFSDFTVPTSGPAGAILSATVREQATLFPMVAFKFPGSWCDANMTSCTSPF